LYLLRRNRQAVSGALSHHQPASEKEHQEAARPQRRLWCAGPPRRHATGDPPSGFWRPLYRKYPLPRDDTPAAASARAAQAIPSQPYPTRRTRPGGIRCLRDQKDTCMTDTQRLTDKLTDLRLKGMLQQLDTTLEQATQRNLNIIATLNLLADLELEHRWHNAI